MPSSRDAIASKNINLFQYCHFISLKWNKAWCKKAWIKDWRYEPTNGLDNSNPRVTSRLKIFSKFRWQLMAKTFYGKITILKNNLIYLIFECYCILKTFKLYKWSQSKLQNIKVYILENVPLTCSMQGVVSK